MRDHAWWPQLAERLGGRKGQGARQDWPGGQDRFLVHMMPNLRRIPGPLCRLVTVLHRVGRGTQVPVGGQSIPPPPHLGGLERKLTAGARQGTPPTLTPSPGPAGLAPDSP